MSHSHSKTYYCKHCGWSGYFPYSTKVERRDERGFMNTTWITLCPDCHEKV